LYIFFSEFVELRMKFFNFLKLYMEFGRSTGVLCSI
jgi:hypothetical protein